MIGLFIFGLGFGYLIRHTIESLFHLENRMQVKAIQKHFSCAKNDFTYFFENNDDFYIVSLKDKEYRIKFSLNKPCKVVYEREVMIGKELLDD